jgi:hypothetical protein
MTKLYVWIVSKRSNDKFLGIINFDIRREAKSTLRLLNPAGKNHFSLLVRRFGELERERKRER